MRGLVSFTLLVQTAAYLATTEVHALGWIAGAISLVSAACLLVGFMTPLIAIVVTIGGAALAFSGLPPQTSIETIVLAIAVSLLGPGAFSLDARMFGRREILLRNTPHIHRSPPA